MKFKNKTNGYIEIVSSPISWLWVLLFGPIYWVVKGVWRHAGIHLVLFVASLGILHLIYPFFTYSILKKHYLKNGWEEIN